jgi:hypothetical protein
MTLHIVKHIVDLPPAIALELIKRGVAESIDEMDNTTPKPMRDRMATKGGAVGADDDR